MITGINNIQDANENEIIFLLNDNDISKVKNTNAAACVINKHNINLIKNDKDLCILVSDNAYYSYAKALSLFYRPKQFFYKQRFSNKKIKNQNSLIHPSVIIGENSVIGHNVVIGHGVKIGKNCVINEHVSISYSIIGNDVTIDPGCIIGQDGFGFVTHKGKHHTIPHIGRVIIGNNVRISCNTVVDKGFYEDTVIEENTLIGSLVTVSHNVRIGKGCIILSQVGIAGGTVVGNNCLIAGQAGLVDYITVGDNVSIAARSVVTKNVPSGIAVAGFPAIPINEWRKQVVYQKKYLNKLYINKN
jgi:UDP-3-O-[3-hydroxymyristoyl] glucosamine N-acyltransferase